ncbi:MAG: putative polysaccharide biosynthesis protein [Bacillota bacterium]|jgi:stage V sporulation protein B
MGTQDTKFVKGAFILTAAGLLVKLIGAVYRIPLYSILGSEGIGLYQMGYPIYAILLTVSSSGLNVAISKVVAERLARGKKVGALAAFRVSLVLMAILGALGSVALFRAAPWIATYMGHDPRATLSIQAISPSLFLASILSAFRGWFQGIEEMTVPAVSQVLEALGRLATMLLLARALMPRGIEHAAAGATFGAAVGAGVGVVFTALAYWIGRHGMAGSGSRRGRRPDGKLGAAGGSGEFTWGETARAIASIALPISLASAVFGITEIIDLSLVPGRLHAAGFTTEEATRLFGQLTAGAMPLVNIPTVFTGALQMAIVPSVSAAMALRDRPAIARRVSKALTLTYALGLPAALGILVLSRQIPVLLYNDAEVGPSLMASAPAVLFLSLQQVSSGVLQGVGKVTVPLVNLMWAALVKAVVTYAMVGIPSIGVVGAGVATSLHFAVAAALNLLAIRRNLGPVTDSGSILKISAAGGGMAVIAGLAYHLMEPLVGLKVATVGAVASGALAYFILAVFLRVFSPEDLASLPVIGRALGRVFRSRK